MKLPAPDLARNPISMIGSALVTLSAVLFLFVYLLDLFGMHTNPYIGIVFFLVMPAVFVFGLLLIPLGMWREHKARLAGKRLQTRWPIINLNDPRTLKMALVVAVLTIVNVIIVGLAAFRGIEYMDSVTFCGQTCHEVMQPEFASYQAGPHARVRCVECHIGSGASWFVKSKVSGARQLYAVAFNTHSRPIPSPVTDLRPARDTCEECHWPEKFHGDKIRAFREYASDETNTESVTVMRIHVGGGSESVGRVKGIHWHTSRSNTIEYIATDDKRQVIPYVKLTTPDGKVKEWVAAGVSADALAKGDRRHMDCMDCHNRPSHQFLASAERAVDLAIARGEIDRTLPFVRREGVRLLKARYPDQPAAFAAIKAEVSAFYAKTPGDGLAAKKAAIERSADALQRLYGRSVFPSMNVGFGTYTSNLGHNDFPGCFRCHDDSHTAKDGSTISQDCELCHTMEDLPASQVAATN
jgi:nitrate/TMAO reductase-like tetraheme cytochrome c subunit